ncbi:MAG: sensor histidine kinase [Caulobacteraceae bacterium]|nr:sensor histidine kinase [Caulobacteraceae bacterium]
MASLAGELMEANQRWFIGCIAPTTIPPRADGFDTDAAWLLAAHACPALHPPRGPEQRRLDTALAEVCAAIESSELRERGIALRVACDPFVLGGWRTWQICVIVAELLLHAARNSRNVRSIAVEFGVADEARCVVVDDGVATRSAAWTRGIVEVDGLVAAMGGRVDCLSDETGSAVMVRVPRAAL